jgi:hypothetical protein
MRSHVDFSGKFFNQFFYLATHSNQSLIKGYRGRLTSASYYVEFREMYFKSIYTIKVNLENDGNLYSACSNLTYVVLVIVLGIIIGKGACY